MVHKILLAQTETPLGQIGGPTGFGPWGDLGKEATVDVAAGKFSEIISNIIGIMTIIAGIWFIFNFISGAYEFLTAAGNEEKIKKAKLRLTHGIIGLIIVIASYAIISLLGALLGFDILNPQEIIKTLSP